MNAIGEDPWNGAARLDLEIALQQAASLPAPGAAPPLALRTRVTLAAAADLMRDPDLLAAYARETPAGDDATLVVVYAARGSSTASPRWSSSLGLDGEDSPDIVGRAGPATQPAQRLLAARATATLGAAALAAAA